MTKWECTDCETRDGPCEYQNATHPEFCPLFGFGCNWEPAEDKDNENRQ